MNMLDIGTSAIMHAIKPDGPRTFFDAWPTTTTYAPNRRLACTPFETLALETQGKTFKSVREKNDLFRLSVVFGNERYRPGDVVYVRGDIKSLPFTREVFEIGGDKFILIPEDHIQLVRRQGA